MNFYKFLQLNDQQQYQAVWEHGVHIDDIIHNKIHYQLYSISNFYVEIHYDALSNKIVGKHHFKQGVHLDKYLRQDPIL